MNPMEIINKYCTEVNGEFGEYIITDKKGFAKDIAAYAAAVKSEPIEGANAKLRLIMGKVQDCIGMQNAALEDQLKIIWDDLSMLLLQSEQRQPSAEGAEEIIESIVESLGEPINIHNHVFEIRPYTVEHKTEWWIFHKEVGSGEPLAQWLSKFAALHAQRPAAQQVAEEIKKLTPSNEQIHEAAKAWARDHSEAPDKDCPEWLIRDYEAGAYFVRQCFGCWNKIDDEKATREMHLNMQYYMEYCQILGYVTPQEWIEKHKHF
jgi:hypothetical protein